MPRTRRGAPVRLLTRRDRLAAIWTDPQWCWDRIPAQYQDAVLGFLRLVVLHRGRRPAA